MTSPCTHSTGKKEERATPGLAGIDRENFLIFLRVERVSTRARVSHPRGGASDPEKNEGLPVVYWLDRPFHESHVKSPKYLSGNFYLNMSNQKKF